MINLYERNVHIVNVRSLDLPILLDKLKTSLLEGVQLSVHQHEDQHYEARHIPDPFVEGLKEELKTIADSREGEIEEKKEKAAKKEAIKKDALLASLDDDDD